MTASGAHLEHEAPERQPAVEVGPYSDFAAFDVCPLSSSAAPPPTPVAQGDDPGEFTEPGAVDGAAGAARGCGRRLVVPVIPAAAPLVVAVAPLLVTLARGGAFAVGGAIFAAPGPDTEAPEGFDGEEVLPH